jgi:hypothetical protein
MALLTYSGRPEAAVAFGTDRSEHPYTEEGEGLIFRRVKTAQALASRDASEIAHATRLHIKGVANDAGDIPAATRFFAALGQVDLVFELLDAYFFNSGRFAYSDRLPHTALTRYEVVDLFWPPMAPVWADRRFDVLAERIGLAAYWRETKTLPDYRNR